MNIFFGGMMQTWRCQGDTFRYRDKERRRQWVNAYMRERRRKQTLAAARKRAFLKKHPTVLTLP